MEEKQYSQQEAIDIACKYILQLEKEGKLSLNDEQFFLELKEKYDK